MRIYFSVLTFFIQNIIFSQISELSFSRIGKCGMEMKTIQIIDYKDSLTSFSLGFLDVDKDGKITFNSKDSIFIDFYGTEFFVWESSKSRSSLKENLIIGSENNHYKLEIKDVEVNELKISKCTSLQVSDIQRLSALPILDFVSIDDSIYSFNNFLNQDKYIFIEIWSVFCSPCLKSFPLLNDIQTKFGDKITIITLLDRGDKNDLIRISEQYKNQFIQGYSSGEINKELRLNGYPTGILFDAKGNLIRYNIRAKELLEFLK
jgi:thiol-disulfide isomerase/thioredoxin